MEQLIGCLERLECFGRGVLAKHESREFTENYLKNRPHRLYIGSTCVEIAKAAATVLTKELALYRGVKPADIRFMIRYSRFEDGFFLNPHTNGIHLMKYFSADVSTYVVETTNLDDAAAQIVQEKVLDTRPESCYNSVTGHVRALRKGLIERSSRGWLTLRAAKRYLLRRS